MDGLVQILETSVDKLDCTMTKNDITIEQDGIFKKAIRISYF